MDNQTGHCEHGEFDLLKGCPKCIKAAREVNSGENIKKRIEAVQVSPEQEEMEQGLNAEGLTLSKAGISPDPDAWRTGDEEVRTEEVQSKDKDTMRVYVSGKTFSEEELREEQHRENIALFGVEASVTPSGSESIKPKPIPIKLKAELVQPKGLADAAKKAGAEVTEVNLSPEFGKEVKLVIARFAPQKNKVIAQLKLEGEKIVKYANERTITTQEDARDATNDLGAIAKFTKAVEKERQYYVVPLITPKKEIDAFFKVISDPMKQADQITRKKILTYNAEIRRRREEIERLEAEKLALARREEILTGEHTIELAEIEKPDAPPERIRADLGMASSSEVWTYEVTDFAQVPDEYKVLDTALVNATVKKNHAAKQIPGIRIYSKEGIRVTTQRGE